MENGSEANKKDSFEYFFIFKIEEVKNFLESCNELQKFIKSRLNLKCVMIKYIRQLENTRVYDILLP